MQVVTSMGSMIFKLTLRAFQMQTVKLTKIKSGNVYSLVSLFFRPAILRRKVLLNFLKNKNNDVEEIISLKTI